ncbi:hypothetical protein J5N97_023322 [Dioscorea zingiberensis]|uniref:Long-chain-alcohol oxidase n=1 Tax=Dioscorea zingiberensis TaxID=325984 RepID=A0A9D5CCW9_9LILI|nr:hypothetical protein J5N97_023322 [Dioscorea zingiberensis]
MKREKKGYSHGFSASQIQSLSAICEAFIPSLPMATSIGREEDFSMNSTLQAFFLASASQPPIPDEVAELVKKRGIKEGVALFSLVLWLLGTRLGTLLLCGTLSLSKGFPFINSFSDMALDKREQVLKRWTKEKVFIPLKLVFVLAKIFCFYTFYSITDEKSENASWKAIGYSLPSGEKPRRGVTTERPLEKGMVEAAKLNDSSLLYSLTQKGLKVIEDEERKLYRVECDVVIAGSGCGGGVAAALLASSGYKVVVVEKGNYFTFEDYTSIEGPSMSELYEAGGLLGSVDGKMMLLAGSTVGGGSAVNWSACIRTPEHVLNEWSEEHQLNLFKSSEYVSAMDANKPGKKKAMKCVGLVANPLSETMTKKLEIRSKITISACGSLLTPALLKKSGLKNPNIGKNLHLHPVMFAWGYFPEQGSDIDGKVFEGGIITSVHKVNADESNTNSSRAIIETPLVGPASMAGLFPWTSGRDMKERMLKYSRMAHLLVLIRDQGSGTVESEGRFRYSMNEVDKENLAAGMRRALRILVAAGAAEVGTYRSDGQRIICKGKSEEESEEFLDGVVAVGGPKKKEEVWMIYPSAHPMGSCRMGANEEKGGVAENGETWEAEGLFVCDGSVIPTAIGVNPMITIQATAYCLAKRITEHLKNSEK